MNTNWNLDRLLLDNFDKEVTDLRTQADNFRLFLEESNLQEKQKFLKSLQIINELLEKTEAIYEYSICKESENTSDEKSRKLKQTAAELYSITQSCLIKFQIHLKEFNANNWNKLLKQQELKSSAFILDELRNTAKENLSEESEKLMQSLALDGLYAWESLHTAIESGVYIEHPEQNKSTKIGTSEAAKFLESPERSIRKKTFEQLRDAWSQKLPEIALALNHIAGFRLSMYAARNWQDFLKESLTKNRISREALDAVWNAVNSERYPLSKFFALKAKTLGLEKLSWYDLEAPESLNSRTYTLSEARELIISAFTWFSPHMGEFAKRAFDSNWIDSEIREAKQQGAFCSFACFPGGKESRILISFSGSLKDIFVLAHELGHAYHFEVVKDLPYLERNMPVSLAETASQFAEEIIAQYLQETVTETSLKKTLLTKHIEEYVSVFCNIHARYLFEHRLYEQRKTAFLNSEELNTQMEQAQRESYGETFEEYKPDLWATKMHFYLTREPFYNYPYTVGFLIAKGLFEKIKLNEKRADLYQSFLLDTGKVSTEDISMKHLSASLKDTDQLKQIVQTCMTDVWKLTEIQES